MNINKWVKLGLLCLLSGGILSACGEKSADQSEAVQHSAEEIQQIKDGEYKFDETVTITTVKSIGVEKYKNGETYQDNVYTNYLKDNLNIDLKYLWATEASQVGTKIRLMLSSGDEMPDVMVVQDKNLLADLLDSGQFKDVTADFEEYASDRLQEVYNTDRDFRWALVNEGEQNFGIPLFSDSATN